MTTDKSFAHKPSSKAPQNAVLGNHCVLVTRPEQQQAELIAALEAWGAQTIPLPLLSISPPSEGAPAAKLRRSLLELDLFDSLLFVSTNAVRAGVASIEDYWPQFPVGLHILAIGPSTAALARELLGCDVAVAAGGSSSEELLASGLLGDLKGKRVGIFRGEGGRDALAEGIRQRGGPVEDVPRVLQPPTCKGFIAGPGPAVRMGKGQSRKGDASDRSVLRSIVVNPSFDPNQFGCGRGQNPTRRSLRGRIRGPQVDLAGLGVDHPFPGCI